jgi:hypothetical protein
VLIAVVPYTGPHALLFAVILIVVAVGLIVVSYGYLLWRRRNARRDRREC